MNPAGAAPAAGAPVAAANGSTAAASPAASGQSSTQQQTAAVAKQLCSGCGAGGSDLYASECSHLTLCTNCGRSMAQKGTPCQQCGQPVRKLVKEYGVRVCAVEREFFIAKFPQGLPGFKGTGPQQKGDQDGSKVHWSLHRDKSIPGGGGGGGPSAGGRGRAKAWLLEDDSGQCTYRGISEGLSAHSSFFFLMKQPRGREFSVVPTGAWYTFQKQLNYRTPNLEEAEAMMSKRGGQAEAFMRRMWKEEEEGADGGTKAGGKAKNAAQGKKKAKEEAEEEEEDDDEDDGGKRRKVKEDIGEDWEHDETWSDDDEAVGVEAEDKEQNDEEEPPKPDKGSGADEEGEEAAREGGAQLSATGKDLQKLLDKADEEEGDDADDPFRAALAAAANAAGGGAAAGGAAAAAAGDAGGADDDDDDDDEDKLDSPVFLLGKAAAGGSSPQAAGTSAAAPAAGGTPSKADAAAVATGGQGRGVAAGTKRKAEADKSTASAKPLKKPAIEPGKRTPPLPSTKTAAAASPAQKQAAAAAALRKQGGAGPATQPEVTEEAVKAILRAAPITTADLICRFPSCRKSEEEKRRFQEIVKKVGKIRVVDGVKLIVLR